MFVNYIWMFLTLPIQMRTAVFHRCGLVIRAAAFCALPLQPVR